MLVKRPPFALVLFTAACTPAASPAPQAPAPQPAMTAEPAQPTRAQPTQQAPEPAQPPPSIPPTLPSGSGDAPPVTSTVPTQPPPPAPPPGQWTLQEKEYWQKLIEEAKDEVDRVNRTCDTKIGFAHVSESYRGHFTENGTYGLTGYVRSSIQSAIDGVGYICARGAMQKAAVKGKIKRIEIKYGTPGKTIVELKGGTLFVTIDPDAGGATAQDAVTKYLMNAL
jgi:hypothetical protein